MVNIAEDKCPNCGNTEDLEYQHDTGETGSEWELTEIYGFECPICNEFTVIGSRPVINTKEDMGEEV